MKGKINDFDKNNEKNRKKKQTFDRKDIYKLKESGISFHILQVLKTDCNTLGKSSRQHENQKSEIAKRNPKYLFFIDFKLGVKLVLYLVHCETMGKYFKI